MVGTSSLLRLRLGGGSLARKMGLDFSDVTTWIIILVVLVILGAGGYFLLRTRGPKEEIALYFRCPRCKRRLRYYARQAGHRGMCSNCKEQFTFPSAAAASG